jgi:predicted MPP superfamily phosphohydrolase
MARTLQFISDLHLERRVKLPFIRATSPYLALIGDIAPVTTHYKKLETFLKNTSYNFDRVFYIAGNHEYKGIKSITETNERLLELESNIDRLTILNNKTYTIYNNYRLAGSTLWSRHPNIDRCVLKNPKLTYKKVDKMHQDSVKWLKNVKDISYRNGENLIVLTHYFPSQKLCPFPLNYKIGTNLEPLITTPITAWLCGHLHGVYNTTINNIHISCNAVGYELENPVSNILEL